MTRLAKLLSTLMLALCVVPAAASAQVVWDLRTEGNTTAAPGESMAFMVRTTNLGDTATVGTSTLTASLPAGMTYVSSTSFSAPWKCLGTPVGASVVTCTLSSSLEPNPLGPWANPHVGITVAVDPDPEVSEGLRTAHFEVSGGGAAEPASTVDPTRVTADPLEFGIDGFDFRVTDAGGAVEKRAGVHPDEVTTVIDLNHGNDPLYGPYQAVETAKNMVVGLPPGFVGNPSVVEQCTPIDLANAPETINAKPLCPVGSQIGVVYIKSGRGDFGVDLLQGPIALYNMTPPPDAPARFGFNFKGTVVSLDAEVRSGGDYGISIDAANITQALGVSGNEVFIWGVPADPRHDFQRSCPGEFSPLEEGSICKAEDAGMPLVPFLRNPTACTAPGEGLATTLRVDSWEGAGDFKQATSVSHEAPGYPHHPSEWGSPVGIEDCDEVPFTPSLTLQPTTTAADTPTGLDVEVAMPQEALEELGAIAQSDVKDARVSLPAGMRINPAVADGLTGCSPAQIGLIGTGFADPAPIRFDESEPSCPNSSKIGTVEIETPLLPDPLTGSVYQAQQDDNPFGSTLGLYVVAEGAGVVVKLPAEVTTDPETGQVTTIFRDTPQVPFTSYRLHLFDGPRAALVTPQTCGTHTTRGTFTPWSGGPDANLADSFQVDSGPNGRPCVGSLGERPFEPRFEAGSLAPFAGAFSDFVVHLSREDGTQELRGLEVALPQGVLASLAGVPYCAEAALASISTAAGTGVAERQNPSCPAASLVGHSDAAAGAGVVPFHTPGNVYLTGPYRGAPLGVAVVTPVVAGPLDLGSIVVRAALHVDPVTAQARVVSDPIPDKLVVDGNGFLLGLRSVRVTMDRPRFTLNPTSCEEMRVAANVTSVQGALAQPSVRFQVGSCSALAFKPKLSLRLKGKTRRGGNPSLRAVLKMPAGNANIARASVALPPSEFLDQEHLDKICTRVQYAAGGGGGEQCPPGSVYGYARAWTPLLDQPLQGPVYLRSSSNELPDLVASLRGQIQVELSGRIDTDKRGGIRSTFDFVPDAPVSKFVLNMKGGRYSLLENSTNICRGKHRAGVSFAAHNGRTVRLRPAVTARCGKKKSGKRRGSKSRSAS